MIWGRLRVDLGWNGGSIRAGVCRPEGSAVTTAPGDSPGDPSAGQAEREVGRRGGGAGLHLHGGAHGHRQRGAHELRRRRRGAGHGEGRHHQGRSRGWQRHGLGGPRARRCGRRARLLFHGAGHGALPRVSGPSRVSGRRRAGELVGVQLRALIWEAPGGRLHRRSIGGPGAEAWDEGRPEFLPDMGAPGVGFATTLGATEWTPKSASSHKPAPVAPMLVQS